MATSASIIFEVDGSPLWLFYVGFTSSLRRSFSRMESFNPTWGETSGSYVWRRYKRRFIHEWFINHGQRTTTTEKVGKKAQTWGGTPFLAAAIPTLVAGGKAAAMGGLGVAANYGTMKALHALSKQKFKRKRKPQRRTKAQWRDVWHGKGPF